MKFAAILGLASSLAAGLAIETRAPYSGDCGRNAQLVTAQGVTFCAQNRDVERLAYYDRMRSQGHSLDPENMIDGHPVVVCDPGLHLVNLGLIHPRKRQVMYGDTYRGFCATHDEIEKLRNGSVDHWSK